MFVKYTEHCGFKSHLRQLFFFSWEKEELSLGVVALLCLVSMTEYACTCSCDLECLYTCTCLVHAYSQ